MKIYALADLASNWYPRQAFDQFRRYSNVEFVPRPGEADLIWVISYYLSLAPLLAFPPVIYRYSPLATRRKKILIKIPIISTVHHLSPAKKRLWLQPVKFLDHITDHWQTTSLINLPYIKQFISKPVHVLPYWIDNSHFYPLPAVKRAKIKKIFKLPPDKTIIGSFQRDTERDLTTPKLEKGPDIFCDIVERLDRRRIFVVLTGPRRQYVERRLAAQSIPYRSLGHVPYQTMNELYNVLDYYLVTSRCEGGPQAILEAMATGTKIFSSRVGVADLLSPAVIFKTAPQCAAMLSRPYPDILNQHQQTAASLSCQNVIPQYEQFFASSSKTAPALNRRDASLG